MYSAFVLFSGSRIDLSWGATDSRVWSLWLGSEAYQFCASCLGSTICSAVIMLICNPGIVLWRSYVVHSPAPLFKRHNHHHPQKCPKTQLALIGPENDSLLPYLCQGLLCSDGWLAVHPPPLCVHSAPCWCCCLELDDSRSECLAFHGVPGPRSNAAALRWASAIACHPSPSLQLPSAVPCSDAPSLCDCNSCLLTSVHLRQPWRVLVSSMVCSK